MSYNPASECVLGPGCLVCPWAAGYLADGLVCGAAGVPGAGWCALLGRAAWCARGRWATWLMVLLVVLLVFQVPSGPTAREIATREPAARSGRSRSPPWPSGPSGTLHTGGACVAVTSPARPYRMGTSAHGRRSHVRWSCGALHACGVGISPLCNGLQVGGDGSLWYEELADGVSPTCRSLE